MENLKIRIPCEEVSKLVQRKAFEEGYIWGHAGRTLQSLEQPHLFLHSDKFITYLHSDEADYFDLIEDKEISWQEWVYGEGFFFTHISGSENIYFQAKDSGCVYWHYVGHINTTCYTWKQFLGSSWIETDMFGNKLEEKDMVKLYDDKIKVELTAYQVAVIKALFGEMRGVTRDRVFNAMQEHLPYSSGKDAIMPHDYVTTSTSFLEKVEALLQRNGYVKEAPKPIKEMTLAEVCEQLGYDVKIKKE